MYKTLEDYAGFYINGKGLVQKSRWQLKEIVHMPHACFSPQFTDLETFANWALATQNEREQKRSTIGPEELQALYITLRTSLDPVLDYLNQFPLDRMPGAAGHLLYLTFSFAEIVPFIECYKATPGTK